MQPVHYPALAQQMLVCVAQPSLDAPAEPNLLVLGPRRRGLMAVVEMGQTPRHPRWLGADYVTKLVKAGSIVVRDFEIPARALRKISFLRPHQLVNYNQRVQDMAALFASEDAELLAYPDEFSKVCSKYASRRGLKRKYVEKLAWLWLTGGKTNTALISELDKCGGPGKKRNFTVKVGGPHQKDGVEFEAEAASPYTLGQRGRLIEVAERIWCHHHNHMTWDDFWLLMRQEALALDVPAPSFEQAKYLLKDYLARARAQATVGLLHQRYKGVTYGSQEWEADSTELQLFVTTVVDPEVRLKNPTYYKIVDVKWDYVAATYVSFEAPSNAILAELLYRAIVGMAATCKELGLPYGEEDFPRLRPGRGLTVDHQELTSPKLNRALLDYLGWTVRFAIVGEGSDKGGVEGSLGKDKAEIRKKHHRASFPKHAVGKALQAAMRGTTLDIQKLDAEIIHVAWERNHKELPLTRVPKEFLKTGRPCNRAELYKWDLERNREFIKSVPPAAALADILLPTDFYPVHAKNGIYINQRYYTSPELVEAGLLRLHAKGAVPQVEVSFHRGTTKFVNWIRGSGDMVKCYLHSSMEDALGSLTVAEADEHVRSQPSARKRERHRKMMSAAHVSIPETRNDREKSESAARKGVITKDKNRIAGAKKRQKALDAKRAATARYGQHTEPEGSLGKRPKTSTTDLDTAQVERVARLLAARRAAQNTSEDQ